MDQLIRASLSHTHYWYEVGMLNVPAVYENMVANPASGLRNGENRTKRENMEDMCD